MSRHWFIALAMAGLLTYNTQARPGSIRTLDGTVYEGNVILSPLGGLVVKLTDGGMALVPLANLSSARFEPGPGANTSALDRFIVFRNGSILPAVIERALPTELQFLSHGTRFKAATLDVAGILTQRNDPSQIPALQSGRTGVALRDGDFIDGEFRGIENSCIVISSVLFGIRQINIKKEVVAIVLRAVTPNASRYQVHTVDGGTFCSLALPAIGAGDVLIVADPLLGESRVPFNDIRGINASPR